MKIAILIPCYNEEKTIGKVVKDHKKLIPEADIYVYDNNSTDDTAKIAKKNGAIVRFENRQGKGNVIRSMFRDIDADYYLMIDGDDTYPAEDSRRMIDFAIENQSDMLIGDRLSSTYFTENDRFGHNFGNKLVRNLINWLFKSEVKDIMTGQRVFSYGFVKTFPVLSEGFQVETEMTIHALDKMMRIHEIPVSYRDRPEGSESKLSTYSDGFKVLLTIFNMLREFKPRLVYGILSGISFVASAILAGRAVIEFFATGMVTYMPSLVVGLVFFAISVLMIITGLLSSLIAKKHRQLFEINLNNLLSNKK
ncbi:MAG: glycosyltransferase family 2 protein [bacterium]|nr:glycosyltransferase family 2 protein [bacterium]MDO4872056.1 glycosyltransferase family 2 protein [bacterium]